MAIFTGGCRGLFSYSNLSPEVKERMRQRRLQRLLDDAALARWIVFVDDDEDIEWDTFTSDDLHGFTGWALINGTVRWFPAGLPRQRVRV
ncbi:hypothetical protein LTR09_004446 [Extremus antarcticus]|uniref:Uncharacterized protein n=1 Tax=Extremus antarcticus TaxID=702011 RepID=A0AAJ0DIR9_9PEZI|nr:hypothetical protein LTR09_004446 [Extremus antarcticus]